jgi:glycerol kinase
VNTHYILSIDQGTTSTRAMLFDADGNVAGSAQEQLNQLYPQPGWVEHDPVEIWNGVFSTIGQALAAAGITAGQVAAIGITNQRETLVVWDRQTGEPCTNAIVWQDRRTAAICDELRDAGHESFVSEKTGLTLDPYFTATKLMWLFRERPDLRSRAESGEILAGTVDSWLLWNLTGGSEEAGAQHLTDFTNASRTLLFNVRKGRWDDELCAIFDIPREVLPKAKPSIGVFAQTSRAVLGAEIPIAGVAGDQQAALFGQACLETGQAKCTYGTGAFLLTPAGRKAPSSANRLLVSLGAQTGAKGPEYVLEGSVFTAGAAVQWLHEGLGILDSPGHVEELAAAAGHSDGVTVVPAFTGLGAPHWNPGARGTIVGISRGTTAGHIAYATLESIALSVADLLEAMDADLESKTEVLRVDGGASRNRLLMQLQADLAQVPVVRPRHSETTAFGAALLAGIGAGVLPGPQAAAELWQAEETFEPRIGAGEAANRRATWQRAVEKSLDWERS